MPTVRKYGPLNVAPSAPASGAIAGQRYGPPSAQSFGAGTGAKISQTLAAVGMQAANEYAARQREAVEEADRVGALRASNEQGVATEKISNAMLSLQGWDAADAPYRALEDYDKIHDSLMATLTTDRQRQLFAQASASRRLDLFHQSNTHSRTQIQSATMAEFDAGIRQAQEAAIGEADLVVGNPDTFGVIAALQGKVQKKLEGAINLLTQKALVAGLIPGGGDPNEIAKALLDPTSKLKVPDTLKDAARVLVSRVQSGVIDRLTATPGQEVAAQSYFYAVRDQLTEDAQTKEQAVITEAVSRVEVQIGVDKILSKEPTNLTKQLELAREGFSGDQEERVVGALKDRENERKYAKGQEQIALVAEGKKYIDAARGKSAFQVVPPHIWKLLEIDSARALEGYADSQKVNKVEIETNEGHYITLLRMANSSSPTEQKRFLEADFNQFQLSKADRRHWENVRLTMISKGAEEAQKLTVNQGAQTKMVDEGITGLGMDPNPPQAGAKGFDQAATNRVNAFRRRVRDEVQEVEKRTGKPATDDEVQTIVDDLMRPTNKTPGAWFGMLPGAQQFKFETTTTLEPPGQYKPKYVDTYDQIPVSMLPLVMESLRKANPPIPFSKEAAVKNYNAGMDVQAAKGKVPVVNAPPPPAPKPKTTPAPSPLKAQPPPVTSVTLPKGNLGATPYPK